MKIDKVEEIVGEVSAAFRKGGIYTPEHPVRQRLCAELCKKLDSILEKEISLIIAQDKIIYEGKALQDRNFAIKQFAVSLHRKGIAVLILQRGIIPEEIKAFFDILALKDDFIRQQNIEGFFKEKGLVHIKGTKLYYKGVSIEGEQSGSEEKTEKSDEEYSRVLELMEKPEEISEAFSEIAKKDVNIDLKARFINQGIEEMSRLLSGKSMQDRERIRTDISHSVNQLPSSLTSHVLDLRQKSSLQKKEDIEDYISSIATIVGDFSGNAREDKHFLEESLYSSEEESNIAFELLPYSYEQEYADVLIYFQKKVCELLEKKWYSQCYQLMQLFLKDSERRSEEEKKIFFAALKKIISLEKLERLLKDLEEAREAEKERIIWDILRCWELKDLLVLTEQMVKGERKTEILPAMIVFLFCREKQFSFYSLISVIKQASSGLQKDIIFLVRNEYGESIDSFLLAEIESEDKELSKDALDILVKQRCLKAVPNLLSLLNPKQIFLKQLLFKSLDWERGIIEDLGFMGDEKAVPQLKIIIIINRFFLKDKKSLRNAAVNALKRIGSQEAVKTLFEVGYGK
ncbi:MAG: HEAT repeat domain-containing protein [Candidatus Omnitrophica bacterium]|nr:HEAT repeat domain-containing protein [Candidatus Omnitrophota bacterium]